MSVPRPPAERGAALLSVLLLVAVMAVIATVMLERLNLAARLAANGQALTQARLAATSAETLAMARLKALVDADADRTVDRIGLLGRTFPLPLGRARIEGRIDDAGNCFNVNSLVSQDALGQYVLRPVALQQLRALMRGLAIGEGDAVVVSDAIADWIDSDSVAAPNGAEDAWYQAQPVPYRAPGQLVAEPGELRAVKGMTPVIYERLRPWLCALPAPELSPVNVNTLRADQARLLAMLSPAITPERARAVIASRPANGYASADEVITRLTGGSGGEEGEGIGGGIPLDQVQVRSRWFLFTQTVTVDQVALDEEALIDTGVAPPRVAFRSWGDRDSR